MGLLDGLAKAGLYGASGYLMGQNVGREIARKNALAQAQAQREAQQDAIRDALIRAQTEAAQALATQRATPNAPPVRNIDPLSDAGISASARRAEAIAKAQARYRQKATGGSSTTSRTADAEEAEGLAILNTPMPPEQANLMSAAFRAIRAQNPSLTPGRVTIRAYNGLKKARPELFRNQGSGGAETFGYSGGAAPPAVPPAPGTPPAALPRVGTSQEALDQAAANRTAGAAGAGPAPAVPGRSPQADRWETLVNMGLDPAAATAQVKREFNLP